MYEENCVLIEVAGKLEQLGIPYMLTGSMAANFYAAPRTTRDIDLVLMLDFSLPAKLVSAFEKDFYIDKEMIEDAIRHQTSFNLIHQKNLIKVDCILRKNDDFEKTKFDRRLQIKIDSVKLSIISPEDLILSKLIWARESESEMQLRDVKNLLDYVSHLDMKYIEHWLKKLHVETLYNKAKKK